MKKRFVAALLALLLLLSWAAAGAETWYRVKNTSVKLMLVPDFDAEALDSYRQDWALTISQTVEKTWAYVTFSNGREGYVTKSALVSGKSWSAWIKKDDTKLYRGPGYSFSVLATLLKGDKVTVLTSGRYYNYVKTADGTYGYVANSVLSKKKVKATPVPTDPPVVSYAGWVVSKGGSVGLRSSASGSNKVVFATYPPGTALTVLEEGKSFSLVQIEDGQTGYMRTKYISKYKPAPIPTATPAPVFTPYTATAVPDAGKEKARLFQGEGLGWSVAAWLEAGTVVNVTAPGKDPYWVKVEVNGTKGYMRKQNLQ